VGDPDLTSQDDSRAEGDGDPTAELPVSATVVAPVRVLVVDDDEDAFVVVRALLRQRGADLFETTWATTATEGLRLLTTDHVDVALVDFRLPDGDGLELIARAREAGSRTPIVLLTGQAVDEVEVAALHAGAIDYVDKSSLSPRGLERVVRLSIERARIAERLRHSVGLYAAVVDAIADGVIVLDVDGRVVTANPSAATIMGRSAEELATTLLTSQFLPMVRADGSPFAANEHPVERALDTGEASHRMVVGLTGPEGGLRWISLSVSALVRPGDSHPYGAVLSFADVTELRAVEDELRQALKMEAIGRLAGGVAHDFNNLLTAISGFAELLLGDLPLDDVHRADVTEISKAAGRAADLTRQLLAFGRRQLLQPRVLDMNELIAETGSLLSRLLGEDVTLELRPGPMPGPYTVRMDPWQAQQILFNLATNARDAMPGGGRLTVETRLSSIDVAGPITGGMIPAGSYVVLSVTDTGTGMDAATMAHAFEPFYTTKDVGRGTGLGLASVHGTVHQSGGYVRLRSEPDLGTTVDIYLPMAPEMPEGAGPPIAGQVTTTLAPAGGSESVLLVDDEESVRSLVTATLVRHGYAVHSAADGMAALEIAQDLAVPLDILVTDVVLPGLDGWNLATHVTELRPGIGTLFISGFSDHPIVMEGLQRREIEFLAKPFSSSDLLGAVRRVLDARGADPRVPADMPT
jgi:two-component system cell cycle sensor histidine kinase/response regulator CckA